MATENFKIMAFDSTTGKTKVYNSTAMEPQFNKLSIYDTSERGVFQWDGTNVELTSVPFKASNIKSASYDLEAVGANAASALTAANDALPKAGGTMSGAINMSSNAITNLPTPSAANDAVSKSYVDAIVVGTRVISAVEAATTAAIVLTSGSATSTIDGYPLQDQDRVLVKDQADATKNGVYVYSSAAGGSYVRAAGVDNSPSGEIYNGVLIPNTLNGTTNVATAWTISSEGTGANGVHTIDTDDIVFTSFAKPLALVQGNGIDITNGTITFLPGDTLEFAGAAVEVKLDGTSLESSSNGIKLNVDHANTWTLNQDFTGAVITVPEPTAASHPTTQGYVSGLNPNAGDITGSFGAGFELAIGVAGTGISGGGGTALSVDYGAASGTACEGDDARLSDDRTPLNTSVTAAKLGNDVAGTGLGGGNGSALTVSYGTASSTACEGNDSRLSDDRTPSDDSVTYGKLASGLVGTTAGTIASGDHDHTGTYSLAGHDHDSDYVGLTDSFSGDVTGPYSATVIAAGAVTLAKIATLADGELITSNGSSNVAVILSGDVTMANNGVVTIGNNKITEAKIGPEAISLAKIKIDVYGATLTNDTGDSVAQFKAVLVDRENIEFTALATPAGANYNQIVGVTGGSSANTGTAKVVFVSGRLIDGAFPGGDIGKPVFVGASGNPVTTPPSLATNENLYKIGRVISTTQMVTEFEHMFQQG